MLNLVGQGQTQATARGERPIGGTSVVQTLAPSFPWLTVGNSNQPLERRIAPPAGFRRSQDGERTFAFWLRALPVKPGRPDVRLYNGAPKGNQRAHYAVLDIDVGNRDLQQCADAVIRLRAEYLRSIRCDESIQFRFTSGDLVPWAKWRRGERPIINGSRVSWRTGGPADSSYPAFRGYLNQIFTYAGSASLARDLVAVTDPARPVPGDVYIKGGSPGHAVLVLDVCDERERRTSVPSGAELHAGAGDPYSRQSCFP